MRLPFLASLLPLAALTACAITPALPVAPIAAAPQPMFDPMTFFTGHLVGVGRLSKVFSGTVATRVTSDGRLEDGVLHLTQVVNEGDKPARTREWMIRQDSPNHYSGTLTDAEGPVTGETRGNRLHLAFTMKDGLATDQWLTLSPDGNSAYNVMKVRKLGLQVAALSEIIRRSR